MKQIFTLISLAILFAACSESSSNDKQAELEKLRKQQAEISQKIKELETSIAAENPDANRKVRFVAIDTVMETNFQHYVEIQGKIDADQNLNLMPRAMGPIMEVNVKVGDRVSKGQVLAVVDDKIIRKSIIELKTQSQLAETVYQKQKNLWDQNIGTEIQYLQAKTNKEALENSLATLNEQLDLTRIKSPIDGNVDEVNVKVGEMVNTMLPAIRVVSPNNLKAVATVAETYLSTIETGDEVIVTFPDIQKEFKTKISFASRAINPMSRTFDVEVNLNSDKSYRPNMLAILKIVDYKASKALTAPINAIQNDQQGQFVMIAELENGKLVAKKKQVEIGAVYGGVAEVKSGLSVGDKIIILGFQDLNEGDLVSL